jgi:zinc transport system ATP-binding protein
MALIKCENVSIGYEGQMVVHDLNFEINQGDYLCIVGENGSTCKESFGTEECG